jgi:hypothetical protein
MMSVMPARLTQSYGEVGRQVVFSARELMAAMCSHIPNRGEQMVRYYGYYSNVSRGKRQKEGSDDAIPCILEPQRDEKTFRRNWALLIQKIYEVDPFICPKGKGTMRVIGSIEDPSVIRAILEHLGLWLVRSRPPQKAHSTPIREYAAVDLQLQTHADTIYGDPNYSWDAGRKENYENQNSHINRWWRLPGTQWRSQVGNEKRA